MNLIKKIRSMPQGVKASAALFIASIVTKGIAYITTPLYTRLLTPEQYGEVSIYLTWVQIFGIIAMFCLSYGVFNNGMVDYPEKRNEYSFSMLMLSNIITVCFSGILLGIYPLIKEWVGLDIPFVILMCVVFMAQPAYNFWSAKQRYELKYKWNFLWSVILAVASPLVALLLLLYGKGDALYARIFGAEVTLIVFYLLFYVYLGVRAKWKVEIKYWKAALLFNIPLIPHYLSTYLLTSSNKLIISNIEGDAATAYYSVAYAVAAVVTIIWSAVNSSLIPYTYECCQKKNYDAISRVTLPILTFFAVACGFVILLAPEVVAIMATADYMEAIYVIPPTIGGVFFQVQYYIYANIVYYYKKPKYVMIASVVATVLNIVLNIIFISLFGYLAAGYVTLVCYLVQATIDYFAMRKVVGQKVYNMRFIGLLSLIVTLVAIFSNLLYDYWIIRYVVLLAIVIVAIWKRNRIVETVKQMRSKPQE